MHVITKNLNNKWKLFILENDHGMQVHFLNFGGIITKILVPDRNGQFENVVLGYKNVYNYQMDSGFLGAIVGPVAGRIAGASFELDGKTYELEKNDGSNHLHGGTVGFHRVLWDAQPFESHHEVGVKLIYHRKDGEGGYPGNLKVTVTYSLNNLNQLKVDYCASTDNKTPVTLTNHAYFNLTGDIEDTISDHEVHMNSHYYLELDEERIPTGQVLDVRGTTFDFTGGRKLIDGIDSELKQHILVDNGYDHYFLFANEKAGTVKVKDEKSGRVLVITTDQPGMVMYTANNLEEGLELTEGKSRKYVGVCFETQGPPASLHYPDLPSIVLDEGEIYRKQTVFSFGVMK